MVKYQVEDIYKIMKTGLLDILKESINEGGVKKDLYTNLKLSKRNEFYEQFEEIDDYAKRQYESQKGYDREVEEMRQNKENSFGKKLRHYFTYLQRMGGMEEVKNALETHPDSTRNVPSYKDAIGGLKLVGFSLEYYRPTGMSLNDKIYVLLVNYFHNGGDSRNFMEGPLDIIPAKEWDIETDYSEDVIEYGTSFGTAYGDNEERVKGLVLAHPYNFEQDRETYDHDYVGDYKSKEIKDIKSKDIKLVRQAFEQ
tara:strand:+ start:240 stop:1001 length:762 start_codon:yes stop_codon:yes gene_type:complete